MIIHDFNFGGLAVSPSKAKAILIVDANAVLSFAAAFERFKMVAGQCGKVL